MDVVDLLRAARGQRRFVARASRGPGARRRSRRARQGDAVGGGYVASLARRDDGGGGGGGRIIGRRRTPIDRCARRRRRRRREPAVARRGKPRARSREARPRVQTRAGAVHRLRIRVRDPGRHSWRNHSWRRGTRRPMEAADRRVLPAHSPHDRDARAEQARAGGSGRVDGADPEGRRRRCRRRRGFVYAVARITPDAQDVDSRCVRRGWGQARSKVDARKAGEETKRNKGEGGRGRRGWQE